MMLLTFPSAIPGVWVGWGGVAWGANNVARHLNSRDATSILPCTMGLTSRMCLARDVLRSVMGFGVVHFMLACILDGEVCVLR